MGNSIFLELLRQSKRRILNSFRIILTVKQYKQFDDRHETSGILFLIILSIKVGTESSFNNDGEDISDYRDEHF